MCLPFGQERAAIHIFIPQFVFYRVQAADIFYDFLGRPAFRAYFSSLKKLPPGMGETSHLNYSRHIFHSAVIPYVPVRLQVPAISLQKFFRMITAAFHQPAIARRSAQTSCILKGRTVLLFQDIYFDIRLSLFLILCFLFLIAGNTVYRFPIQGFQFIDACCIDCGTNLYTAV
jgi:hypothetical protein